MLDVSRLVPPPAGFGRCRRCAYRDVDRASSGYGDDAEPWAVCYACASQTIEQPEADSCPVCGLALDNAHCRNPICSFHDRYFSWSRPIAKRTGVLERAINSYKYDGYTGWALIFGRVLVGFLDAHEATFGDFDVIVPSPTYVGDGGRPFDHIWGILEAADAESYGDWPFEENVIVKTRPTTPFVRPGAIMSWRERKAIAEGELRAALNVPAPADIRGKRILVFDDVFTDGLTIREVARALMLAGAEEVAEVVLARQPFRRR